MHKTWTTARELDSLSASRDTAGWLPALLRRLIHATAKQVKAIDFPAWDMVSLPGFDGTLDAESDSPWIPDGVSVWEVSTEKKTSRKANDDFVKRTQAIDTASDRPSYVAVTTRLWSGKQKWQNEA